MLFGVFLSNVQTVAVQVVILYLIVGAGFVADKTGKYTEKAARLTTDLLFYIITPCVIIESFEKMQFSKASAKGLIICFLCGVATYAVGISYSRIFFRKMPQKSRSIFRYSMIYGNAGYLALPLAEAVLGAKGVFYCSIGVVVFNIFAFTQGVWQMSGLQENMSIRHIFINPGTIGIALGLPLFLLSVDLPSVVGEPVRLIGSMNTPLAMLIFGTYLSNTDLKTMFKQKETYAVALVKLVLLPVTMLLLFRLAGLSGTIVVACIISACAPTANNTVMFAAKFDKDTGLASKVVAATTAFSIITMPIIIALTKVV